MHRGPAAEGTTGHRGASSFAVFSDEALAASSEQIEPVQAERAGRTWPVAA